MKNVKKNIKPLILKIFKEILNYHETLGKNSNNKTIYRINSYKKAIKSIEKYKKPIYNSKDVMNIPFIGNKLREKIDLISINGTLNMYEDIKKNNNIKSIKLFQKIWGIGAFQAQNIINNNIYTIKDLKKAIRNNNIKLTKSQLIGLKYYNDLNIKIPRIEIIFYTNKIKEIINNNNIKIYNAGSYRCGKLKSGDIDLILSYKKYNKLEVKELFYDALKNKNIIIDILSSGIDKSIYIIKIEDKKNDFKYFRKMDVAYVEEKYLPWYLLYFGSSKDFSKKIRSIALKLGYKLNEKGIYNKETGIRINFDPDEEKDIFTFLNIEYIPPEKRI